MIEWLGGVPTWGWLTLVSAVSFVACLIVIPIYLARAPEELLLGDRAPWRGQPWRKSAVRILKNLLGLVLLIAGAIMLVGPGQGVLTIVVALGLLDFPGKRRLQRKLLFRPRALKLINRLRRRAGREPLDPRAARSSRSGAG